MTRCFNCAHENPINARFCVSCGIRLGVQCQVCGEPATHGQRFCSACGAALASGAAEPSAGVQLALSPANYTPVHLVQRILANRQALRGEKKQVTVLFCDLVDSTVLASQLGAEDMHALLSDFFTRALAAVHSFEGTVNQFLGDGFMAIFGAPLAHEDHAARAGLAALAIREAIASARASSTLRGWGNVQVRMGLNSGQVVVGAVGDDLRMDYTAVGDTTHLAARLQSLASPGEILCGETTVQAARGALEVDVLEPVSLKGIPTPVARYRLLKAHEHTRRITQSQTSFVGRNLEMTQLMAGIKQAAEGTGGVIEIEGEPGAGKSRLMLEFKAHLPMGMRIALGQCITYGNQKPNVPIIELARGLLETELAHDTAGSKAEFVSLADNDYLAALIGDQNALNRTKNMDLATMRGRTQEALAEYVRGRSQHEPLILMVEDLHWASSI